MKALRLCEYLQSRTRLTEAKVRVPLLGAPTKSVTKQKLAFLKISCGQHGPKGLQEPFKKPFSCSSSFNFVNKFN